ncbi:hypothetical protein A2U01_0006247, partial [Trifolium medium]|nr:hypothetical protein [Trifolium medium]
NVDYHNCFCQEKKKKDAEGQNSQDLHDAEEVEQTFAYAGLQSGKESRGGGRWFKEERTPILLKLCVFLLKGTCKFLLKENTLKDKIAKMLMMQKKLNMPFEYAELQSDKESRKMVQGIQNNYPIENVHVFLLKGNCKVSSKP